MTTAELNSVLRIESQDGFHMTMEHPGYGELVLPIDDPGQIMAQTTESAAGPTDDEFGAFQAGFQEFVDQKDIAGAYQHARAFTQRFPLQAHPYTLQAACCEDQGQLDQAAFHFRQSIAIQPSFRVLGDLGRVLGKQKKFEDSLTILRFLFENRDQASSPRQAIGFTQTLLVTLTQLQRGEEMVQVADAAIASYGAATVFLYQAILGLLISGQAAAGLQRLESFEGQLNPADPMTAKFAQLKTLLLAKTQASPA